jgi:hypothetical protein
MNIFVIDECPIKSAQGLPDRHITKMGIETCQMISVVYSPWYFDWGAIPKKDGTPYKTERGAFRNHPCTQWIASSHTHLIWTLLHGYEIVKEFEYRYGKKHGSLNGIEEGIRILCEKINFDWKDAKDEAKNVVQFARAMPDEFKYASCSDIEAYKMYMMSKIWPPSNYLKAPQRKPKWMINYDG